MTPRASRIALDGAFLAWMAAILVASVIPGEDMPDLEGRDLAAHALAYAVAAALFVAKDVLHGRRLLRSCTLAIVVTTAFGVVMECVQGFVPGRHPSLDDVAANAIGGLLGAIVSALAMAALRGRAAPAGS